MNVTLILADAAQEVGGKLYILGGGWSVTGPEPTPMALAIKIGVPWDQANRRHQFKIMLLGEDGERPQILEPATGQPQAVDFEFGGDLEVGRPPGLPPGTEIDAAMAVTLAPIPLIPGRGYVWRLEINGESKDHWQLAFRVRSR
jgi:hypothetical protein